MRKPTVATVGSIIVDLAVRTPRVPVSGENLLASSFRMGPGGKGANAAAAMARLGACSIIVGAVGRDRFGTFELEALRAESVDAAGVRIDQSAHTGVAIIMVDDRGENTIVVVTGANATVTGEQALGALEGWWERLDAVLVNFEVPETAVAAVLEEAGRRGVASVVDAGPERPWGPATWCHATVLSPNQSEAEALVGRTIRGDDELEAAARELVACGPTAVVIKRGERGALVCDRAGSRMVPAFPVEVVDTTGAGDAFTAALTVSLADGQSLDAAVRRACAAGALAVTRFGTMPAMPRCEELERFLRERG